jgi:hypothetical protein
MGSDQNYMTEIPSGTIIFSSYPESFKIDIAGREYEMSRRGFDFAVMVTTTPMEDIKFDPITNWQPVFWKSDDNKTCYESEHFIFGDRNDFCLIKAESIMTNSAIEEVLYGCKKMSLNSFDANYTDLIKPFVDVEDSPYQSCGIYDAERILDLEERLNKLRRDVELAEARGYRLTKDEYRMKRDFYYYYEDLEAFKADANFTKSSSLHAEKSAAMLEKAENMEIRFYVLKRRYENIDVW